MPPGIHADRSARRGDAGVPFSGMECPSTSSASSSSAGDPGQRCQGLSERADQPPNHCDRRTDAASPQKPSSHTDGRLKSGAVDVSPGVLRRPGGGLGPPAERPALPRVAAECPELRKLVDALLTGTPRRCSPAPAGPGPAFSAFGTRDHSPSWLPWTPHLEDFFRVLMAMLPVKRGDSQSEVAFAVGQSALDLIGLARRYAAATGRPGGRAAGSSPHRVRSLRFMLRGLQSVQLMVEAYERHYNGKRAALRACLTLELLKFIIKVVLWTLQPSAEATDDPAAAGPPSEPASAASLLSRPVGDDSVSKLLELLFHLRPFMLLYILWQHNEGRLSKWKTWILMTMVDVLTIRARWSWEQLKRCHPSSLFPQERGAGSALAALKSRQRLLSLPLLRSPFFDVVMQRPLQAIDRLLKQLPLCKRFSAIDVFLAFRPYYSSTAGT